MSMTKESMAAKIIARLYKCDDMVIEVENEMLECLEWMCQGIIDEIQANARITMANADFQVLPGTFEVPGGGSITGEGDVKAYSLTGKIS